MLKRCGFLIIQYTNEQTEKFVLMQLRHDGRLGFIGGGIEDGEEIEDGIIREVLEEASYGKINKINMKKLKTSIFEDKEIHTYIYDASKEEIEYIMTSQIKAQHFLDESFGFILVPVTLYQKWGVVDNFLKNIFSGTAKEELNMLM
ncbi:MAG TPA: hypothetical protein DEP72_06290 [Clostridiales bacterium]|nr:MAG: hypothetical protein A2Y18_00085 [Clostridiales bacterium GWD2_32_19]HCC07747.1 hypothetical protein [Clostridiales bacterium]